MGSADWIRYIPSQALVSSSCWGADGIYPTVRELAVTSSSPGYAGQMVWRSMKERRSRLWKWNPARLICRSFRAWSIFLHFLGFRFAPRQAILRARLRRFS
jgi:hypothetical protein